MTSRIPAELQTNVTLDKQVEHFRNKTPVVTFDGEVTPKNFTEAMYDLLKKQEGVPQNQELPLTAELNKRYALLVDMTNFMDLKASKSWNEGYIEFLSRENMEQGLVAVALGGIPIYCDALCYPINKQFIKGAAIYEKDF